jgi:large subunit ribosomal protein L4
MQLDLYNISGDKVGKVEVRDDVFGVTVNEPVVHQALTRQMANKRLGTASTKTRGEVKRSSRKLYAQKHTGRARRGAADSPVLVGGGIAFGPHPRSYHQAIPKKMRKLAIKSVLSDKVNNGLLKIVDSFNLEQPKTREMFNLLLALGIDTTALFATTVGDTNLVVATKNLTGVKTLPAKLLNVADMLSYRMLVMSRDAVMVAEELWGQKSAEKIS